MVLSVGFVFGMRFEFVVSFDISVRVDFGVISLGRWLLFGFFA